MNFIENYYILNLKIGCVSFAMALWAYSNWKPLIGMWALVGVCFCDYNFNQFCVIETPIQPFSINKIKFIEFGWFKWIKIVYNWKSIFIDENHVHAFVGPRGNVMLTYFDFVNVNRKYFSSMIICYNINI